MSDADDPLIALVASLPPLSDEDFTARLDALFAETPEEFEARLTPELRARLERALATVEETRKLSTEEWVEMVLPSFVGE